MYLVLRVFVVVNIFFATSYSKGEDCFEAFRKGDIVPNIIPVAPKEVAYVKYPSVEINLGNLVNSLQTADPPTVTWQAKPDRFYTLLLVGDIIPGLVPSNIPILGNLGVIQHWLVVNIPGNRVEDGEVLSAYLPSLAPPGLGRYHYVFLIYEQASKQEFHELGIPGLTTLDRIAFSVASFEERYNFSGPLAGNFFLATPLDAVNIPLENLKKIVSI